MIPRIRIPLPREVNEISKKFEITNYYRHCVASFELFYIFLLKFLVMPITYSKWKECISDFNHIQEHYTPFVKKHYHRYMKYYKQVCGYYIKIKSLLDMLRIQSIRYPTTSIEETSYNGYDW